MASDPLSLFLVWERSRRWFELGVGPRFPRLGPGGRVPRFPTLQNDLYRLEEDAEIEPWGHMLQVVEVVAHLLRLFVEVVGVAVADLRPSREPRPNDGPERVKRNLRGEEVEV